MKLIVDENLPRRLSVWLVERGHQAIHVSDMSLLGVPDSRILAEAAARGAGIVTRDCDFDRLALGTTVRVMRLAVGNCSTPVLLAWLQARWTTIEHRWNMGGEPVIVVN